MGRYQYTLSFFTKSSKTDDCSFTLESQTEALRVFLSCFVRASCPCNPGSFLFLLHLLQVYICFILVWHRGRASCDLSLHSLATSAESYRNMCWEGNPTDSHLCVQHSAGGGWEIAGSGVKVSGWTTEATARKPPDFYPTTEAEQEIRRAAGESFKRIIQFLILFWRITETKHEGLK